MNIHSGLTAVFEQHDGDYIAYIEEIPGVNTQGSSLEEARINLVEALELFIEVRRELAKEEQEGRNIIKEQIRMVA